VAPAGGAVNPQAIPPTLGQEVTPQAQSALPLSGREEQAPLPRIVDLLSSRVQAIHSVWDRLGSMHWQLLAVAEFVSYSVCPSAEVCGLKFLLLLLFLDFLTNAQFSRC
jgi:hypothetical protein